jgi:hypothetical protein
MSLFYPLTKNTYTLFPFSEDLASNPNLREVLKASGLYSLYVNVALFSPPERAVSKATSMSSFKVEYSLDNPAMESISMINKDFEYFLISSTVLIISWVIC